MYNRTIRKFELSYVPKINGELRKQIAAYIETGNISSVNSNGIIKVISSLAYGVGPTWARQSNAFIKNRSKAAGQMGFNERIVQLMRASYGTDFLNACENITDTTKKQIQSVLDAAAQEGWGIDEIVRRLKSPQLTAARAKLISRTETVAAANAAAVLNVQDLGYEFKKVWIAAIDSRTRPDHKELDGKTTDMMGYFQVRDKKGVTQKMMQPGDRSLGADAGQLCNCRCAVAFE